MYKLYNGGQLVVESEAIEYSDAQQGWVVGNTIYPDFNKVFTLSTAAAADKPPTVSVTAFKLLFTSQERIAIANAKATDPVIADFYSILDDQRTKEVNLALLSVQNMLDYLIAQSLLDSGRKAEILTGVVL